MPRTKKSSRKPLRKRAASAPARKRSAKPKRAAAPEYDMGAWMAANMPGTEHDRLRPMAGTFNSLCRFFMAPDAPPMESTGVMKNDLILDGRFLDSRYEGNMMGSTFKGQGLFGFDNATRKYIGTWIDGMSTGIISSVGKADPSGRVFTLEGRMKDPISGKDRVYKQVTRIKNDNEHVFETFEKKPNGKWVRSMEIVYTRSN